jgi:hypothetical protein
MNHHRNFGLTSRPVSGQQPQAGSQSGADNTRAELTAEAVRYFLDYDPVSGVFRWKNLPPCSTRTIGSIAGSPMSRNYWKITINRKTYLAHRLAWLYVHGCWPRQYIDHIDGDPRNNAIQNLREADALQNAQCCRANGFYHDKRHDSFTAQIRVNGNIIYLGSFKTSEAARATYFAATEKYFGEFSAIRSRKGVNHD